MSFSDGPKISQEDFLKIITETRPDLFGEGPNHTEEATMLKKAWYNHVLLALEKLNSNMDKLSNEIHTTRETLYKEIVASKELMRKEMSEGCRGNQDDMDKLESRIIKTQDMINVKVEALEKSPINIEIEKKISKLKDDIEGKIAPIRNDVTIIRTKLAMWASICGVVGSGFFALISKLTPYILKLFGS